MTLTAQIQAIDHRSAATAAAGIHLHRGGTIVERSLSGFVGIEGVDGLAVIEAEQGLAEWFPHDRQPLEELAAASRAVAGAGWTVAVIVPSARMGEAHRALRGSPVTLQAWWPDGDAIRFGGPEVP